MELKLVVARMPPTQITTLPSSKKIMIDRYHSHRINREKKQKMVILNHTQLNQTQLSEIQLNITQVNPTQLNSTLPQATSFLPIESIPSALSEDAAFNSIDNLINLDYLFA